MTTLTKDEGAARGLNPSPFRCPKCELPPIDVDGDPFADESCNTWSLAQEMHINCHCENGHSWFEAARFNREGAVIERVSGPAGTRCTWSTSASESHPKGAP